MDVIHMNDNKILSIISIPGMLHDSRFIDLQERVFAWETQLDLHFNEPITTSDMKRYGLDVTFDLPDLIPWRHLVGSYIFSTDIALLRFGDPINRGRLLPVMCMMLLFWGTSLQGLGEDIEAFFIPLDTPNEPIVGELSGFSGAQGQKDNFFYNCLESLNQQQRDCIAEFIDLYFGIYLSTTNPWYTEKHAQAAKQLAEIWRNG